MAVKLSRPSFEDARADVARLEQELDLRPTPLFVAQSLPETMRAKRYAITVTRYDGVAIDVEPGHIDAAALGLAINIGTSKIIAYLHDLHDGRLMDQEAVENPQMRYGEDVVTRITEGLDATRLAELKRAVTDGVNMLIGRLCARQEVEARHIYDATWWATPPCTIWPWVSRRWA